MESTLYLPLNQRASLFVNKLHKLFEPIWSLEIEGFEHLSKP